MSLSYFDGALIDPSVYMVHTAQLNSMSVDQFGQTSVTTVTTVNCYVYTGDSERRVKAAVREQTYSYECILPNTLTVNNDDQLILIKNYGGETVLNQGTIVKNILYDHYLYGSKFQHVYLKVN